MRGVICKVLQQDQPMGVPTVICLFWISDRDSLAEQPADDSVDTSRIPTNHTER